MKTLREMIDIVEGSMEPKGGELNQLITDYANTIRDAWELGDHGNDEESNQLYDQASEILGTITARYGDEAAEHAEKAGQSNTFGREGSNYDAYYDHDRLGGGLRQGKSQDITKAGKIPKNTQNAMKNDIKRWREINGPHGVLPEEATPEAVNKINKLFQDKK